MSLFAKIEKSAELATGLSADDIRNFTPTELREYLEKKNGKKLSFSSDFPIIGRGNVLRNDIKGTDELNKEIDQILSE